MEYIADITTAYFTYLRLRRYVNIISMMLAKMVKKMLCVNHLCMEYNRPPPRISVRY